MTYTEELKRLDTLLSEAFIEVRDNYGMPNSREVAEYLLEHGVEVHCMKDTSRCYRLVPTSRCSADSEFAAYCDLECDFCKYRVEDLKIQEGRYSAHSSYCDDYNFGKTVFATEAEAEAQLQAIKDGQVSAISVEYVDKLEDMIK